MNQQEPAPVRTAAAATSTAAAAHAGGWFLLIGAAERASKRHSSLRVPCGGFVRRLRSALGQRPPSFSYCYTHPTNTATYDRRSFPLESTWCCLLFGSNSKEKDCGSLSWLSFFTFCLSAGTLGSQCIMIFIPKKKQSTTGSLAAANNAKVRLLGPVIGVEGNAQSRSATSVVSARTSFQKAEWRRCTELDRWCWLVNARSN